MNPEMSNHLEEYANQFNESSKNEAFEDANKKFFESANKLEHLMKEYNLSTEQLANPENLDIPADKLAEIQEAQRSYQEASEARDQATQK